MHAHPHSCVTTVTMQRATLPSWPAIWHMPSRGIHLEAVQTGLVRSRFMSIAAPQSIAASQYWLGTISPGSGRLTGSRAASACWWQEGWKCYMIPWCHSSGYVPSTPLWNAKTNNCWYFISPATPHLAWTAWESGPSTGATCTGQQPVNQNKQDIKYRLSSFVYSIW